jgi:HSP20 family protein
MTVLERWTPFRDLEILDERLQHLFPALRVTGTALPAADVFETGDEIVVELDVPGYLQDQLKIEATDHTLVVTGQRERESESKERKFRVHERLEAKFERRFELPPEADPGRVTATHGKGVLTMHIPKTGRPSPVPVTIEQA